MDRTTEDIARKFDERRERNLEERKFMRNGSGISDPTAYKAMKEHGNEEERFHKLLHIIFYIVNLAGFNLEGRIKLVDRKTGRVWE